MPPPSSPSLPPSPSAAAPAACSLHAGADVLHVASSDLGQSLGNSGATEVRRVMSEVIPRIQVGGKFVGVGGNSPADTAGVAEFIRQGANFVTISAWGLLRVGAEDFPKNVNAHL